jgi:hypothetical protein
MEIIWSIQPWWVETFHEADAYVALFTGVLAVSTILLWWSTRGLWSATKSAAERQEKDTRILQRAYVSVQAAGIRNATTGELIGHISFVNVGHLPASQVKWHLEMTASDDPDWGPPVREAVRDAGGLHPGVGIKRGSKGISIPSEQFIYVWGRVTYLDGFDQNRFTNFCHRYNTVNKFSPPGGGWQITEEDARQHDKGNDFS